MRSGEILPKLRVDLKSGSWSYLLGDTGLIEVSSSIDVDGACLTTRRAEGIASTHDENRFCFYPKFLLESASLCA